MKQVFRFIGRHYFRLLLTIGLVALMFHWGYFGFLLLPVRARVGRLERPAPVIFNRNF